MVVPSNFVLGVKRELSVDHEGRWSITMSMAAFIEDLYEVFKEDLARHLGKRIPKIPFPEGLILTKANTPDEGEIDKHLKGYQKLVGSLLWAVRHVSPICSYGVSQLCKLMATPTELAWKSALHMLAYLYEHRHEGITFSETNANPVAFVDASNKDDMHDGRTQYGYTIMWGGPIICKSGKLNHVGINSTYNEYMALHHAIKQITWLRQLMNECGLSTYLNAPTQVWADNKQANNLCNEDMITAGNMYFRTGYHYNKEAVRDGLVKVSYIDTAENISDAMTKGLGSNKIAQFKPIIHGHLPLNDDYCLYDDCWQEKT